MRNISKLLIVAFLPICVYAQSQPKFTREFLPVLCGKTADFMKIITAEKEKLSWTAKENDSSIISFWQSDKTYSVLKTDLSGEFSCLIGDGTVLPTI